MAKEIKPKTINGAAKKSQTGTSKSAVSKQSVKTQAEVSKSNSNKIAPNGKARSSAMRVNAKSEPKQIAHEKTKIENSAQELSLKDRWRDYSKKEKWTVGVALIVATLILLIVPLSVGLAFTYPKKIFTQTYANQTKVGITSEYLGEVERKIPSSVSNEGLDENLYPTYGYTKSMTVEQKEQVIAESRNLTAVGTWVDVRERTKNTYDAMDKEGNLYLNGVDTGRDLYKHSASVGLYYGNVSDEEKAIVKKLTIKSRGAGYNITGLYAPAGEIIKIQMSKADLTTTGGLYVHIGQALYNGQANNIWAAKNVNRMPVILNTMVVNSSTSTLEYDEETETYTFYVGSFLGGPIYIAPGNNSAHFSTTISGAVRYSHYILGQTSPEEFEQNAKSSAPYFDLMVWDCGVLHSGPKIRAQAFTYDQLHDAAVLWEKVSLVSTRVRGTSCGIVFVYDPFVAAGAAVAFPGRNSVNCPDGWMGNSLNYDVFVKSGAWGNMHEYNHNFQGFGLPAGGEVTNNSLNLVSYSLFTKISSARTIGTANEGQGGWNRYTSASWSILQGTQFPRSNQLSIYSTLLHCFGQENFIQTARTGGTDNYFTLWSNTTHNDMRYFATMTGYPLSEDAAATMAEKNYSMFVPVASIYQTGRSYMFDGKKQYVKTVQPYVIKYKQDFTVDLRKYEFDSSFYVKGSIAIPEGFSVKVKKVSKPKYGKMIKTSEEGVYTYRPDGNHLNSGEIKVTLEIIKDNGAFKVDDVDLVLEFEQSYEINKTILERTVYSYTSDTMYTSACDAFEANYAGATSSESMDSINSAQNSNTDAWYSFDEPVPLNTVTEIKGKIHVDEIAKYRIALRGRWNCALYISTDEGKTYTLAAKVVNTTTGVNFNTSFYKSLDPAPADKFYYTDLEDLPADSWVYFKIVSLAGRSGNTSCFVGLGWGKFTPPQGTYDENGELVGEAPESISVSYASAYRSTYKPVNTRFESDYFYIRPYNVSLTIQDDLSEAKVVSATESYDEARCVENILNKDSTAPYMSKEYPSVEKPVELVFDLGKSETYSRCIIQGYRQGNKWHTPNSFTFYVGNSLSKMEEVASFTNGNVGSDGTSAFNFDAKNFRYVKFVITKSSGGALVAIKSINFLNITTGNVVSPNNEMFTYRGNWQLENSYCSFGHIYSGKNASLEFSFKGTRFAIFSDMSKAFTDFEVLIDGQKVSTVKKSDTAGVTQIFTSQRLSDKTHKVVIRSKHRFNIDSIALWQ